MIQGMCVLDIPLKEENLLLKAGSFAMCAPGERTFYRVKVPNPPGSGKGIAEHQGCPL
jgi:hypothetical protein